MSDPVVFQIENGQFALGLVDTAAVGYLDTWQAPGGKAVGVVTLADYDPSSATFMCQVTSEAITAAPDTTTQDIPATICVVGRTIPTPGETSFSVEISILQDPQVAAGISKYLFDNDTKEAYFYMGFDDVNAPKAIGRVRLVAATIGGAARTPLTADVTMSCTRKPSIEWGAVVVPAAAAAAQPATTSSSSPAAAPAMAGSTSGE